MDVYLGYVDNSQRGVTFDGSVRIRYTYCHYGRAGVIIVISLLHEYNIAVI